MSHCGKCHRDAPEGARFCAHCGSAVIRAGGAPEPVDPLIGKTLKGTYLVQEIVGGGGMGKVYKATHLTLDVPVALKVLKRELLDNPSLVQRFHREARAATRLRHPNVIGVTDFGQTEDGTLFMAMEFVAGRGLGRIIAEESPLSEARVIRIGAQILAALAEAHAAGVLHRDLKPGNVMVEARRDEPDFVKVIDFGIAKIQVPEDRGTLTQAGMVWGTPCYMSPEQWNEEELDARTDLYSVGVILYEMLAGQKPYEADTPMAMLKRLLAERPVPPHLRRAGISVSPVLENLVLKALAFHRADRPASADEMRAALLACAPGYVPQPIGAESRVGALRETAEQRVAQTVGLPPPMPEEERILERPTMPTPAAVATKPAPDAPGVAGPKEAGSRPMTSPKFGLPGRARIAVAAAAAVLLLGFGALLLRKPTPRAEEKAAVVAKTADAAVALPAVAMVPNVEARLDAGRSSSGAAVAGETREGSSDGGAAATALRAADTGDAGASAAAERPSELKGPALADPTGTPVPAAGMSGAERKLASGNGGHEDRAPPAPKEVSRRHGVVAARDVVGGVPTPPASSGDGVLSIRAEPVGDVFLDGQAFGEAPREFRVAAGSYAVRVTNVKFGVKEMRIEVRAGRRAQWTAELVTGR